MIPTIQYDFGQTLRETPAPHAHLQRRKCKAAGEDSMRSILLMVLGVPLPIILLLAMCSHHF
jgi:hypothetical protein